MDAGTFFMCVEIGIGPEESCVLQLHADTTRTHVRMLMDVLLVDDVSCVFEGIFSV